MWRHPEKSCPASSPVSLGGIVLGTSKNRGEGGKGGRRPLISSLRISTLAAEFGPRLSIGSPKSAADKDRVETDMTNISRRDKCCVEMKR